MNCSTLHTLWCWTISLLAMGLNSVATAQTAPPPDHIADEAHIFTAESKTVLAAKIRQWESETGCSLFLATTTFLSGTDNIRDHADQLAEAWMPDGRGLVLAYDRASEAHAVTPTLKAWEAYPAPEVVEALRAASIPFQTKTLAVDQRISRAAEALMAHFSATDAQLKLHAQLLPGYEFRAAVIFLIILSVGALLVALLMARIKRRQAENAVRHFFPAIPAAERLGAPYGGGVIAERS